MKTKLISSEKDRLVKVFDNISIFSLYLIIFFLPISKAIIESLSILAIVSFLIKKFIEFEDIPRTPLNLAIYTYLVICVFSIFISSNLKISARTFFAKTLEDIAFFFMVVETLNNERRLKNILYILFASSLLLGIDGIYQYFTHNDFIRNRPELGIPRIHASFLTPNAFGCYLATVIPFIITPIFSKSRFKISSLAHLGLFILLFICLLLTVSRGAWLSFLASILFMSVWIHSLVIFLLIVTIFMIAAQPFYIPILKKQLGDFFIIFSDGDIDRKMMWRIAWNMFGSSPWLGVGLGTFMFNFKKFAAEGFPYGISYAHNCHLQMASEIGIIGWAAFLFILFSFFYKGIKTLNSRRKAFSWYILLASQAAILGYSVQMGVDTILYSLDLGMLFWFVLAIGIAALKILNETNLPISSASRPAA